MSAILLLRFNEPAKISPSDELGNLGDLSIEAGLVAPTRVSAWTGFGRRFIQAQTTALIAADVSTRGTLLQRDVTIQALLSITLAGASGPQTVIARGTNDGTISERYAYGLELQEQAGFPGFVEVRWFWQDGSGAIRTQPPGVFQSPGDGAEFLLTATRRWESTSRVVVRYYLGDQLIAELVSADGDLSGGTTGHTTIGARKAGGTYGRYLSGVLDELLVADTELSLEEIRHTWKRLTEYQPGGVETFAALSPPGSVWYQNPGNDIGKRVKIAGQLLGLGVAGAEQIRALILPDHAPLAIVERWERICELAAAPVDSLDVRRARILAFLSRDEGFQLPPIQIALSGPFALDPSLVQILEFTNTITDDFSATSIDARWLDGGGVTWSIVSGQLQAFAASSVNLRWEDRATPWLLTSNEPGRLYMSGKLAGFASMATSVFAGLALHNRATGDWLWFGVYNNAGTKQLAYRKAIRGAAPSAEVVLVASAAAGPYWLRISTSQTRAFVDDGSLTLSYSTTSASSGFTDVPINTGITTGWLWAGFALYSNVASPATSTTVTFDDFLLHPADSLRPFYWYAFRDPALPGNPDMVGAHLLVQKIKPAYTHAAAIARLSCICDDPLNGLCDRGPCA
jgi:hypothetical protein